jgi:hypothetical protein
MLSSSLQNFIIPEHPLAAMELGVNLLTARAASGQDPTHPGNDYLWFRERPAHAAKVAEPANGCAVQGRFFATFTSIHEASL